MNIVGSVFRREVVPITRTIFTDVSPTLEQLAQTESRAAGAALHATENGGREAADLALQQATTTAERNMITHSARTEAQLARGTELEAAASQPQPVTNISTAPTWNKWQAGAALGTVGAGTYLATNAINRVDNRVGQLGGALVDIPVEIGKGIEHLESDLAKGLASLGRHMPTGSDLAAAIRGAEHSAHDITTGLAGPAQTGVTVLVVLAGIVAAYEMYRFVR